MKLDETRVSSADPSDRATGVNVFGNQGPNEVVFIYLGKRLPPYAVASLHLAAEHSGAAVRLIGNEDQKSSALGHSVTFTPLEDFYDRTEFADASKFLSSSPRFRGGFWHKALERFYVLEAFWRVSGQADILHAELDQLLFRVDVFQHNLRSFAGKGLFFPFHGENSAIASVFYANSRASLRSLLQFPLSGVNFPNEMVLLRMWAIANPDLFFRLPSLATVLGKERRLLERGSREIDSSALGGIVDAAQLGQWVGGIDPRNVALDQRPATRFQDKFGPDFLSSLELSALRFELTPTDGMLHWEFYQRHVSGVLFNLHLHSKAHQALLRGRPSVTRLLEFANEGRSVVLPGARSTQVRHHLAESIVSLVRSGLDFFYRRAKALPPRLKASTEKLLVRSARKFNGFRSVSAEQRFNTAPNRPGSQPYISGDGFRSLAGALWEEQEKIGDPTSLKAGDIVFCESEKFEGFVEDVLEKIRNPVVLVLGNSDRNFSSSDLSRLAQEKQLIIFAQNLVEAVDIATPLPIGLENFWRNNHGIPETFDNARGQLSEDKLFRILWGFRGSTNPAVRGAAALALVECPVADETGRLGPGSHRDALVRYGFVASPPGNGLDTHRTWEAMYLGCVPIVLRSHMTEVYERFGLPVWIVEDYLELRAVTERQLQSKYEELTPKFECPALWFDFWEQMITAASESLKKQPPSH
jgi:hypothetical protein